MNGTATTITKGGKMTKKDYILIAKSINMAKKDAILEADFFDSLMIYLSNALKQDNQLFDREQFINACKGN